MAVVNEIQEPLQQLLALFIGETVDVLNMTANREDALPSGHGVGSDNGVNCLELSAHVLRGSTRLVIQLEAGALSNVTKAGLLKGSSQRLKEFLVRLADAVIDFIARGPEGVYLMIRYCVTNDRCNCSIVLTTSSLGKLNQSKGSVISRDRLKGDITMPASGLLLLGAKLIGLGLLVELVELNGADGANLGIIATKFSLVVQ